MDEGILCMAEAEVDLAKKAGRLSLPRKLGISRHARSSGTHRCGERWGPAQARVRRPRAPPDYAEEEARRGAAGSFTAGEAQEGPGLVQRPGGAEFEVGEVPRVTSSVPGRARTSWGVNERVHDCNNSEEASVA